MITAVLGWAGTIGCFATYVMVSRGYWVVTSVRYSSLNAVGGILGGTASAMYGAWPSAVANFAWAVVAVHTLSVHVHRRLRTSVALEAISEAEAAVADDDGSVIEWPETAWRDDDSIIHTDGAGAPSYTSAATSQPLTTADLAACR